MSGSGAPASGDSPYAGLYTPAQRNLFLFILFMVGTSSAVDRVIISVLLEPIKAEFQVSDTMLGLLSGLSFALLYSVLGVPIARLADRGDRKLLITVALSVWSLMTILCAAAMNFWHLLLARVGVGAGESGATPPAQSLIVDYFPASARGKALGILATTGTVGYLIGLSLGSQLVAAFGWRVTLVAMGAPGLLIAAAAYFLLEEPRRRRSSDVVKSVPEESFTKSISILFRKRTFVYLLIGFTIYHFVAYGSLVFVPSYLVRVVGSPIEQAGLYYGATSAVAVFVGSIWGGMLSDRLINRDRRWVVWFPSLGYFLSFLPSTLMFLIDDLMLFLVVSAVSNVMLYASLPAAFSAIHAVCGSRRRATAIALVLFFGNLLGFGVGPLVTGVLSDIFAAQYGQVGLRYALLLIMTLTLPTAFFMYRAGRTVLQDWEE